LSKLPVVSGKQLCKILGKIDYLIDHHKNRDSDLFVLTWEDIFDKKSSMPRIARVVVPAIPHHMTQRGNYHLEVSLF